MSFVNKETPADAVKLYNYDGEDVRIVRKDDGQTWWVAHDVCKALGLTNTTLAVRSLDEDEHALSIIKGVNNKREMTVVNEPGLYHLIFNSRKPAAKKFRRWVTHVVLPQIRRTGSYLAPGAGGAITPRVALRQIMDKVLTAQVNVEDDSFSFKVFFGEGAVSIPGLSPELEELLQYNRQLERQNKALKLALRELL